MLPNKSRFVIVGAGIHGLSVAWHLARRLRGTGGHDSGADIVVLDKTAVGAGASGIACGVIRNNYFQPAMRRLMAHSVGIWERHRKELSYHPVGYLQVSPEAMRDGVVEIHEQQQAIGYDSTFVDGAAATGRYLGDIFPDWQARGVTSVLHEKRGGYANNLASLRGLATLAEAEGVRVHTGVTVTDVDTDDGAVRGVVTDQGTVGCEQLVVAAGPWVRDLWGMLDLPDSVTVRTGTEAASGQCPPAQPMWTYRLVQEGTLKVDPSTLTDARGNAPPVVHVDTDAPLYDESGLVTDELWGIYYKPDSHFGGVQGGGMPRLVNEPAAEVAVDPYGPGRSSYITGGDFARFWTAGLAHCHQRFEGSSHLYDSSPSGGIGCFTPDSFPVFDSLRQNAYVIADSNHGYKMVGVGALVAEELLGQSQQLLEPFRFSRYERGELHPTSNSPFPWS